MTLTFELTPLQIKNVEIFKLRFGDAALAGCEVMIKDLQDSKRIDTRVHQRNQVSRAGLRRSAAPKVSHRHADPSSRVRVSRCTRRWSRASSGLRSNLRRSNCRASSASESRLLPQIRLGRCSRCLIFTHRTQSEYDKAFVHYKPDKKLRWLPQLGTVNLTIELKDRSLTLDATPLQASLLELFNQEGASSLCLLSRAGKTKLTANERQTRGRPRISPLS